MSDADVRPLSAAAAIWVIARLTLRRLLRGRALIIAIVVALLPAAFAAVGDDPGPDRWRDIFVLSMLLLAVVPPLHLAPAIADEIDGNTFTYLWSRPLPRWTVIAGKLVATLPVIAVVLGVAMAAAFGPAYGDGPDPSGAAVRGVVAIVAGVVATGCLAVGIGSFATKHGLAVSIIYVLVIDLPIHNLPFSLSNLSITHHVRTISQVDAPFEQVDATAAALVWLAVISAAWVAVALWRVSVTEYATDK